MFFKIYNEARYPTAIGDASAKNKSYYYIYMCT